MVQWFFDSLHRECKGNYDGLKIVVLDFYADEPGRRDWLAKQTHCDVTHVPPKHTVWQGKHRLTTQDYYAISNTRNTIACYAPDGFLAYVDDLSVLRTGWLDSVRRAMQKGYVVCGSYRKVLSLVVENGEAVYWRDNKAGVDPRLGLGREDGAVTIPGGAMYGCSLAMPIEALLDVNGFDENTDCCGLGGEDSLMGLMLEHCGWPIKYDIRMQTLESEERHHWPKPLLRIIEKKEGDPLDASWAILNPVLAGHVKRAVNYFGEEGLAGLRQRILKGESFPIMKIPDRSWYSGKLLSEL